MPRPHGPGHEPASRRRQSRLVRWLLSLIVFAAASLAALNYLLDPARLGAWLLQRASGASGLQLSSENPARLHLWPGIQLSIDQLTVAHPGKQPFAGIEQLRVRVPLTALWQDWEVEEIRASGIELDWQRYADLGGENTKQEAEIGPPRPWQVPTFRYIELRDLRLKLGEHALWIDRGELAPLASGETNRLALSGHWLSAEQIRLPFELQVVAELQTELGDLDLRELQLSLNAEQQPVLQGQGQLLLDRLLQLTLHLEADVKAWPSAWPAAQTFWQAVDEPDASTLLSNDEWNALFAQMTLERATLDYRGALDLSSGQSTAPLQPAQLQLVLSGDGQRLQLSAVPHALLDWWQAADRTLSPPPIELQSELKSLQIMGQQLQGLRIESLPAADANTAEPSAADAGKPLRQ